LATKKKNKTEKQPRELTRRQLSQHQRQVRRQRITAITGVSIIVAIILLVLVGYYFTEYRPMHQTVIRVNDTRFDMEYYLDGLALQNREGMTAENLLMMAESAKLEIEKAELVRQGALALGYSATDEEAKGFLDVLNLEADPTTLDMAREQVLLQKLHSEHFMDEVPESMPQAHVMAMLLESESQVREVREELLASGNFTALAAESSLHAGVEDNQGDFGWHPESILALSMGSQAPAAYAFGAEAGTLSQPVYDEEQTKTVGYWLVRVPLKEIENEAQTQAILLGSEDEALEIRARLEDGEELAALAEEFSQEETTQKHGGELGIVSQGELSPAIDEYIFGTEMEINEWSQPIRDETATTQGAYWLIKVADRDDDRPLDSQDRDYLVGIIVQAWVDSLWLDPAYEIDDSVLDIEKQQWAAERLAEA
jgi:hypothetical protein